MAFQSGFTTRPRAGSFKRSTRAGSGTGVARRGTSLIEVVVAMGVASVVLATALAVVHLLLKAERNATKGIWYSSNVTRLSRVLRTDVNAAERVELVPSDAEHGQRMTLYAGDGRLATYEVDGDSVSRVARAGDREHRDLFRFPESSEMRFDQNGTPNRVRFVLTLARHSTGQTTKNLKGDSEVLRGRTVRVEATVSRDSRFALRK